MRILPRRASHSVSRSPGSWLTLLLLFVVLVPSLGLWWFMRQALENERLAARQKLIEAYHAQLQSGRQLLAATWIQAMDELAAQLSDRSPGVVFAQAINDDRADAIVCFDATGRVTYPDPAPPPRWALSSPSWAGAQQLERSDPAGAAAAYAELARREPDPEQAAQAWLAHARSLIRANERGAALAVLNSQLQEERFRPARDVAGRLLAPNADLLALEIARDVAPDTIEAIRARLEARLRDYANEPMPAAQRLFLGREVQRLSPADKPPRWLSAEMLAAAFLEAGGFDVRGPTLRPTALADVWQQASADGRVILLHRSENLPVRLLLAMGATSLPADQRLDFVPPGSDPAAALLSLPVGDQFPGWRLVLTPQDPEFFDTAASARATSYAWILGLVVVTIVIFAALAWGLVRRQVALTQLRNDLVANVTHELKTPLASMRLLVETLLNTPQLHEQTTREYLQLIATENLRLSRLIGNFLTFSRIERNKYTFDFKTVRPQTIVDSAVAAVRDRFQAPGCRFDVQVAANLPPVTADADAAVTALVNLLDNAWKYSGETKAIVLSAEARDGAVVFAVRDNGIGLAPRDANRVFQRFYQVHQHLSSSGGGCGLGLSIVQFIVSAHRGTVSVDSEPGRGSTFTITLPAAGAQDSP